MLQRSTYSSEEEREAELLASMILARAEVTPSTDAPTLDAETRWLRDRIARARDADGAEP